MKTLIQDEIIFILECLMREFDETSEEYIMIEKIIRILKEKK